MSFKNYTRLASFGVFLFSFFLFSLGFAQPIDQTFSSAGSFTYTIPAGYTATLTIEVWGGGGGGGTGGNAAGGGGGGAYARSQFLNAPAGSYTVVVGAGGIGAGTNITGAGGASSFSGTGITTVTAAGGTRGGDDFGGAGGLVGSSGNQANFSGGNGGNRNGGGGGGGGSSASAISNGNNGGNGTGAGAGGAGGVLTGAGSGGRGSDRDGTPDAAAGTQPGGGGGARGRLSGTSKNGGIGRVVVTVSNVLPITLASFQARSEEGGAMITWKVTSEINNDKMLVLRSKDGQNFQEIGEVKGRGTSTVPFEYRYFDANPGGGETYYRLKQVDFDGTSEYSKIIVLNTEGFIKLFIYPNPTRERVFVKTTQDVIDKGLHLYDALGRKHNLQWLGGAGLYEATLPPQLTPGLYLISDSKGENKGKLLVQ